MQVSNAGSQSSCATRGLRRKAVAHEPTGKEKEVHQERLELREVGCEATGPARSPWAANTSRGQRKGESAGWARGAGGLRMPDRLRPSTGKSPEPRPFSQETTQPTDGRRSRLDRATSEEGSAAGSGHLAHTHPEADSRERETARARAGPRRA